MSNEEPYVEHSHAQIIAIADCAISYFLVHNELQRLVVETDIVDDKVAVEPIGFNRSNLIDWHLGRLDNEQLLQRCIGYWHSASNTESQESTLITRAFIACFRENAVIGLQRDKEWYLPGGIIKGPGTPTELLNSYPSDSLRWYLKHSTGLDLVGLSPGLDVTIFNAEQKTELTVLYDGIARGELIAGTLLSLDALPNFAFVCGNPNAFIRWAYKRLNGYGNR